MLFRPVIKRSSRRPKFLGLLLSHTPPRYAMAAPPVPVDPAEALSEATPVSPARLSLSELPRDIGWLLIGAGIVGEIAPGVIGTPFWVSGALILWPDKGRRVERLLERRAPRLLAFGQKQVMRFLVDLDRRYPR